MNAVEVEMRVRPERESRNKAPIPRPRPHRRHLVVTGTTAVKPYQAATTPTLATADAGNMPENRPRQASPTRSKRELYDNPCGLSASARVWTLREASQWGVCVQASYLADLSSRLVSADRCRLSVVELTWCYGAGEASASAGLSGGNYSLVLKKH
jgi:hypothetical protein